MKTDTETPNIDNLLEQVTAIKGLLEAPEPGIGHWRLAVAERLQAICGERTEQGVIEWLQNQLHEVRAGNPDISMLSVCVHSDNDANISFCGSYPFPGHSKTVSEARRQALDHYGPEGCIARKRAEAKKLLAEAEKLEAELNGKEVAHA